MCGFDFVSGKVCGMAFPPLLLLLVLVVAVVVVVHESGLISVFSVTGHGVVGVGVGDVDGVTGYTCCSCFAVSDSSEAAVGIGSLFFPRSSGYPTADADADAEPACVPSRR